MPVVFILIGIVLAIFAVGYPVMARYVTNAGALYSCITRGLSRPAGTAAAAVALIAYNGLRSGLYGVFGVVTSHLLAPAGVRLPWWGVALIAWAIRAGCGVRRVDFNGRLLMILLAVETGIVLAADAAMLAAPAAGSGFTVSTLSPAYLTVPGLEAAIVVVATAVVGFEVPTVYAEEARHPRRTVPIATFAGTGLVGGLYAFSSWALTVAIGPSNIVSAAKQPGTNLLFNAIAAHLGHGVGMLARVLLITSIFAGLLAFHNTVARYTFVLGRERVLPPLTCIGPPAGRVARERLRRNPAGDPR
jgi:amino acid transporter